MTYYVFIDDKRPFPNEEIEQYDITVLIRNFTNAILFLNNHCYDDIYLSLDFDLVDEDGFTGYDILKSILLEREKGNGYHLLHIHNHSDLPIGYDKISSLIQFYGLLEF